MFAKVAQPPAADVSRRQQAAMSPQRAGIGNQAVLRRRAIQPKLQVGAVNDPLEHEADRIAERVMRMPDPVALPPAVPLQITRKCAACEEDPALHMKPAVTAAAGGVAPPIVDAVLSGSGRPLEATTRAFFEPRLGHDLSQVRVHTDDQAARSAQAVAAQAYAVGEHLVFAAGRYEPDSADGKRLLGHELTHTLQQRRSLGSDHSRMVRRDEPKDAGAEPLPGGVPETPPPRALADLGDAELGAELQKATDSGDAARVEAIDQEMDRRAQGWGVGLPRGPAPVTTGASAISPDVALKLLDNMSQGKPPFRPEEGIGGSSWFTTEGNPYTSVGGDKSVNVQVEITKGSNPLTFRESDLLKLLEELAGPTRTKAELEYRAKFGIPEGKPLSNRALKNIQRVLSRFVEKEMWKRVGEQVAASQQKVGEVVLEAGSKFSDTPGKFAVVADSGKIALKGGTAPLVEALAKQGVGAEPVVVEAAEALARKLKWAGRVRTVFRYGGVLLIAVALVMDAIKIYRAHDRLKAFITTATGWAGAAGGAAIFAAWWTPADVAGPWAWAAHGVGTLIAGGVGYWVGSETARSIYELFVDPADAAP